MKIVLAATTNWLLKPFALLLSLIFNGLFAVISGWTTSQALAITIVLFTLIVRLAMMPLMLNQQRSSRRMTRLQPKVQKIQEKYKNKKDPESNQRMQAEIQELYKQNKANPMSGCLPLLIQMPIIFALFEVLRNVPFYVNTIGNLYENLATIVQGQSGYGDILTTNFSTVINGLRKFDVTTNTSVMDLLYHLSRTQWKELIETFGLASNAEFGYRIQYLRYHECRSTDLQPVGSSRLEGMGHSFPAHLRRNDLPAELALSGSDRKAPEDG